MSAIIWRHLVKVDANSPIAKDIFLKITVISITIYVCWLLGIAIGAKTSAGTVMTRFVLYIHTTSAPLIIPLGPLLLTSNNFNTLVPRQDGRHFPDAIFKWIFLNENVWILIKISLNFVPRDPFNNIPALFKKMAWHRPGYKPLSESMMA